MKTWIGLFCAVLLLGTAAFACGDDESGESSGSLSKAEAQAQVEEGALDYDPCEEYGWYGDGECDDFCPEPDPSCDESSENGDQNGQDDQNGQGDETNKGDKNGGGGPSDYGCESDAECLVGGCSSTACYHEDMESFDTTCEWLPQYACYQDSAVTSCGCRSNGLCGWDETDELNQCLDDAAGGGSDDDEPVCAQVITYGVDPETGECEEFPTPCDVPEGWESSMEGCPEDDEGGDDHNDECQSSSECVTGGCSSIICHHSSDEPPISTCEWQEHYACYQDSEITTCGCFEGSCQWDDTEKLSQCIDGTM